jgi:hypothetical protein
MTDLLNFFLTMVIGSAFIYFNYYRPQIQMIELEKEFFGES